MSHRLMPTSGDGGRKRGGHAITDAPRTPPKPPPGLTVAERRAWRGLWASPVSALWTVDDVPTVVRLIRLRARIDDETVANAPVSLFAQVASLEDKLILTPRARRREGILLLPSVRKNVESNGGNGQLNKRERERLLRG